MRNIILKMLLILITLSVITPSTAFASSSDSKQSGSMFSFLYNYLGFMDFFDSEKKNSDGSSEIEANYSFGYNEGYDKDYWNDNDKDRRDRDHKGDKDWDDKDHDRDHRNDWDWHDKDYDKDHWDDKDWDDDDHWDDKDHGWDYWDHKHDWWHCFWKKCWWWKDKDCDFGNDDGCMESNKIWKKWYN